MATNLDRGSSDDDSVPKVQILPHVKAEVLALAVALEVNKARIEASGINADETKDQKPDQPVAAAGDVEKVHEALGLLNKAAKVTFILSPRTLFSLTRWAAQIHARAELRYIRA